MRSSTLQLCLPPESPPPNSHHLLTPGFPTASIVLDSNKDWRHPLSTPPGSTNTPSEWTPISGYVPCVRAGTYIAFQLDRPRIAEIAVLGEGSEERQKVLGLETKKYVGLVLGSFQHHQHGGEDEEDDEFAVAFVGRTLPPKPPLDVEGPIHCIPISSDTSMSSGHQRLPLQLAKFPWESCYQYTVLGTRITPTKIYRSESRFELNDEEFAKFDLFAVEDYRTLLAGNGIAGRVSPVSAETTPNREEDTLFENIKIPEYPLPVEVWEDITIGDGVVDPVMFVEETKKLSTFVEFMLL